MSAVYELIATGCPLKILQARNVAMAHNIVQESLKRIAARLRSTRKKPSPEESLQLDQLTFTIDVDAILAGSTRGHQEGNLSVQEAHSFLQALVAMAQHCSPGYADFVVVTRHARAAQLEYRQHDPVVAQVAAEQRADDIMQQLEGLRDALRRQEATHAAVLHQLQAQGALQASSGDAPTGTPLRGAAPSMGAPVYASLASAPGPLPASQRGTCCSSRRRSRHCQRAAAARRQAHGHSPACIQSVPAASVGRRGAGGVAVVSPADISMDSSRLEQELHLPLTPFKTALEHIFKAHDHHDHQ
ncbi:methionine adenosyltransferase 2 subunit beta [Micractinium conductrix]|uniref:Methionine adenosyltransferase 2 subunit beta n=1 Tax=Micractinium conductrix TaxID=554055 RepID=A0A2P6V146_9CHLO|nr:methionine adenosyltransferase 2 subunit beta [Micractinium conductrix]|eukprot:PSC67764.1 methionine adenosyltransferase 2 subunit beta [Micractinium conductrix]